MSAIEKKSSIRQRRREREVTVVDARMGRGKSSAAIAYMNDHSDHKRFIYVTPFLSEVTRICELCDFDQPDDSSGTKSADLKRFMYQGKNIASTHSLFLRMDRETLSLAREKEYTLIVDESIQVVSAEPISASDFKLVTNVFTTEDSDGWLTWKNDEYTGVFSHLKQVADAGSLYRSGSSLLNIVNPRILDSFNEIFMLTYLFKGQYLSSYLEYFGFSYKIIGVKQDDDGYYFSDGPDSPPPMDYSELITIVQNDRMNSIGDDKHALSKAWFARRNRIDSEVSALRRSMNNFFRNHTDAKSDERLWTTFKGHDEKLVMNDGRYRKNFLQISAKGTNEYRHTTAVAYMANRFTNPNIIKFFSTRGSTMSQDSFALAEMLQFIWRSAIRDGKPITLYIPSKRMRTLLTQWMDDVKNGKA